MTEEKKFDKKTLEELLRDDSMVRGVVERTIQDPYDPKARFFLAKRNRAPDYKYAGVPADVFRADLDEVATRTHKNLIDYISSNSKKIISGVSENTLFEMANQLDGKFSAYYKLMNAPDSPEKSEAVKSILEKSGNYSSYFLSGVSNEKLDYCFKVHANLEIAKKQKSLGNVTTVGDKEVFSYDRGKIEAYFNEQFGKIKDDSVKENIYYGLASEYLKNESAKEKTKSKA